MTCEVQGRAGKRILTAAAALVLFAGFVALGVWQLERLQWKLALIARVDARVHAAPVPAPGPAAWPAVSRAADEYLKVRVRGVFENNRETLVQAVSELGPGFWVMTPLKTDRGDTVLVNRGFIPADKASPAAHAHGLVPGETTVTGLLRISEPGGGFLRANRPAEGRWYSRDVAAIARARGLSEAAPYFIDADATPNAGGWPRGGMTIVHFRNAHLVYALTWFGMAALTALWSAWPIVEARRRGRRRTGAGLSLHGQPS